MTARAIHISDLHRGKHESPSVDDALVALCADLQPELVVVSGDLSNRGRLDELRRAKALFDRMPVPVTAVPGNHDIPYTVPARFSRPWRRFEEVFGTTEPVVRTPHAVVCGLNSVRPWRHQGGRLHATSLARAAAAFDGGERDLLRVAVLHHHLAGAPWRASRKLPLKNRDAVLRALADAGAEVVLGGHIHQGTVVERRSFEVVPAEAGAGSLVLSTAPGLGRPRPHRLGEANGLHVLSWDEGTIEVESLIWDGGAFVKTGTYRTRR